MHTTCMRIQSNTIFKRERRAMMKFSFVDYPLINRIFSIFFFFLIFTSQVYVFFLLFLFCIAIPFNLTHWLNVINKGSAHLMENKLKCNWTEDWKLKYSIEHFVCGCCIYRIGFCVVLCNLICCIKKKKTAFLRIYENLNYIWTISLILYCM